MIRSAAIQFTSPKKARLQAQHQLIVSCILALTVVLLTAALLWHARYSASTVRHASTEAMRVELMRQVELRGQALGALLANQLITPLHQYKIETMRRLLENALRTEGVLEIVVTDEKGLVVHDGSPAIPAFGQPIEQMHVVTALRAGQAAYLDVNNGQMLLGQPVRMGNTLLGVLLIRLSLDTIQRDIEAMEQQLRTISNRGLYQQLLIAMLIAATLLGVSLIGSSLLSRYLIQPIKLLANAVSRIGSEGGYAEIQLARKDELGELADAFNQMTHRLARHEAEISHIAYHDPLTGLPNRLQLIQQLANVQMSLTQDNTFSALMFIDLDDFKQTNDTLGHEMGDRLLKLAAERLTETVHALGDSGLVPMGTVSIYRLGGDEFTILVHPLKHRADASIIARRIISRLKEPFTLDQQFVSIGASIGITLAPEDGDTPEEWLKNADLAMYHAKNTGKNAYRYFDRLLSEQIRFIAQTREDIQQAINHDQFQLYYQPQLRLTDGRVIGAEALIRWRHPQRGWLSPADFIPIAEESGQINQLGEWILDAACRHIARWSQHWRAPFHVAINLSARQLADASLGRKLKNCVQRHGIRPQLIHLEVTETMLIRDQAAAATVLEELHRLGFAIWLDDFGTGFSSLSHLQQFPLQGIKIDQRFIRNLCESKRNRMLTEALVTFANTVHLDVIAEGIETEAQRRLLVDWGCELGQGFLFHKPIPAEQMEALMGFSPQALETVERHMV